MSLLVLAQYMFVTVHEWTYSAVILFVVFCDGEPSGSKRGQRMPGTQKEVFPGLLEFCQ